METPSQTILTIDDVAAIFGLSRSTVRRGWYEGTLPAPVRIGRRCVRWRLSDIEDFIAKQQGIDRPHPEEEPAL